MKAVHAQFFYFFPAFFIPLSPGEFTLGGTGATKVTSPSTILGGCPKQNSERCSPIEGARRAAILVPIPGGPLRLREAAAVGRALRRRASHGGVPMLVRVLLLLGTFDHGAAAPFYPFDDLKIDNPKQQTSTVTFLDAEDAPTPRRIMDSGDGEVLLMEASPSPGLDCSKVSHVSCGIPLPCTNDCTRTPMVRGCTLHMHTTSTHRAAPVAVYMVHWPIHATSDSLLVSRVPVVARRRIHDVTMVVKGLSTTVAIWVQTVQIVDIATSRTRPLHPPSLPRPRGHHRYPTLLNHRRSHRRHQEPLRSCRRLRRRQ